jgi:CHASE3 domain sensor protein
MPPTLVRAVAVRFVIAAAFIVTATACLCSCTAWFLKNSHQTVHSRLFIRCLSNLQTLILNAETGQRGFLLTDGDAEYLRPYEDAIKSIGPKLDELTAFADIGSPHQRRMAGELKPLIRDKLAELAETIRLRGSGDGETAVALVKSDQGRLHQANSRVGASPRVDVPQRDVARQHLAQPEQVAEVGQVQGRPAPEHPALDDHLGPGPVEDLLVDPQVQRALDRLDAQIRDPLLGWRAAQPVVVEPVELADHLGAGVGRIDHRVTLAMRAGRTCSVDPSS